MRLFIPDVKAEADVDEIYGAARPVPPDASRPWLSLDMVSSVDGATHVKGRSAGLSGPADKAVFMALRTSADGILVGAGTARTENYKPAQPSPEARDRRRAAGRASVPPIIVVSCSGDLDPSAPLFVDADPDARTVVAVPETTDAPQLEALGEVADVVRFGDGSVDLAALLAMLHARGMRHVVCEGGPTLNSALFAEDLIDEICGTIAPTCVGGTSSRMLGDVKVPEPFGLRLEHLAEQDGWLFPRWVRDNA